MLEVQCVELRRAQARSRQPSAKCKETGGGGVETHIVQEEAILTVNQMYIVNLMNLKV